MMPRGLFLKPPVGGRNFPRHPNPKKIDPRNHNSPAFVPASLQNPAPDMRVKKICPLIRASDLMTGRVREPAFVLVLP